MTLHAETSGFPAAREPLVLLHGFGSCAAVWQEIRAGLPADLPVIAYDLPGHAGSLAAEPGGAGRMAKALSADLSERQIGRFHLCGHSLGGATAALIALKNPEAVLSLTLLAPGGFGPEINADALSQWRDAADVSALRKALDPMTAPGFMFPEHALVTLAKARSRAGAHAALSVIFKAMVGDNGEQGTLPRESLSDLAMPVRLLWGSADGILPVEQSDAWPPPFRVERIAGAGHMLIEERPQEVLRALLDAVGSADQ